MGGDSRQCFNISNGLISVFSRLKVERLIPFQHFVERCPSSAGIRDKEVKLVTKNRKGNLFCSVGRVSESGNCIRRFGRYP